MNSKYNFWKNKKVLLTGHTGFKGGWLSLWLAQLGAKVTGYSLAAPTNPNFFDALDIAGKIDYTYEGDIRNLDFLSKIINKHKPEIIFHMAAQPLVRFSYQNPIETYSTNVMGTVNLLEAVRNCSEVRGVVVVTSDKCYENREQRYRYKEYDRLGGHDPYSNSKACAELVTQAYNLSYFNRSESSTKVATVRAGNVIGGGDWAEDRLIPDIIRALSNNQSPIIRHPDAIRPWQHVLEPLSGYLTVGRYLYNNEHFECPSWNFGPAAENEQTVSFIADNICKIWGNGKILPTAIKEHSAPHEATLLSLDNLKAEQELQWKPKWDIYTSLEKTIEWYKKYYSNREVEQITLQQLSEYQL